MSSPMEVLESTPFVYVVMYKQWDDTELSAVFRSEEGAQSYIDGHGALVKNHLYIDKEVLRD